jgi:hypothetical protein
MPRNARRRENASLPADGFWNASVSPYLGRFALPLALCLILVGAVRIVSTYRSLSITGDEPYHFSCGLDYLATGRACAPENPPFQPLASALLPFLDGARPDPRINARFQNRFDIGRQQMWLLLTRAPDPWTVIARMRAGVLPFFVAAALAVFFGTRHFFGKAEAVLSTALFTLVPSVLAHAGLATTDIALTATLIAAFFVLAWWSEAPSWTRAAWLGLAVGLAVFSKFSAIAYLAAAAALGIVFHVVIARPSSADLLRLARERAAGLGVAAGVAALVLWAGCGFSFGTVEGWPSSIKVPAPELFGAFRELMAHTRRGHQTYLLGEFGRSGWWHYYPVVLFVKTPIALMLAAAAGVFACWQRRNRNGLLPVALCLGILVIAMTSSLNIGVRHVLPIFAGLAVIGAIGLIRLARISVVIPAALVAWMAISGARAHPDYLSYFNEFAGDNPEEFIIDSDLEWDQSWARAGRLLRAAGASEVTLDLGHIEEVPARVYGLPAVRNSTPMEVVTPGGVPRPGWHLIDVGVLRILTAQRRLRPADPSVLSHLVAFKGPSYGILTPVGRVGGLAVFYCQSGSARVP